MTAEQRDVTPYGSIPGCWLAQLNRTNRSHDAYWAAEREAIEHEVEWDDGLA